MYIIIYFRRKIYNFYWVCSIFSDGLSGRLVGYHGAGDNVKFGLPMAFTITMLSWGVIDYVKDMAMAGEYVHAHEAIKWGTDYFELVWFP